MSQNQKLMDGIQNYSKLAKWKGSDYLPDLTKSEALQFKDYLLTRGH